MVYGIDSTTTGRTFAYEEVRSADSLKFPRFNAFTTLTAKYTMNLFQKIVKVHFGSFIWQTKRYLFMLVQLLVTDAMSGSWISTYRNCHLKQSKRISALLRGTQVFPSAEIP
jgi:hypothetical protein